MSNLNKCSWKLVSPSKFIMGQVADRCGDIADVIVWRPNRKTDLFLCEDHLNDFIAHWGLHNRVEIICRCEDQEPFCIICGAKENIFIDTGICYCCQNNGRCPHRPNAMNGIDWDDIPPVPVVADPALVTYRISSGTKLPKKGRTCTCRNGCKAWDCDGGPN